ncbi:MAG: kinA [Myxococcales bacterium]|nr:kinA [Myxococcales bacterium]
MKRRPPERATPTDLLQRRYRELQERYRHLLQRLDTSVRADSATHRLSWFALQSSSSAIAMLRDGHVELANPRWRELSSARGDRSRGWTVRDQDGERQYPDLGTLAAAELARFAPPSTSKAAGDEAIDEATTLQCNRTGGDQILRVRLERVVARGDGPVGLVRADDVTAEVAHERELSRLRDAVAQRERLSAVGRLAAGIAHDLGNTVNALALRVALVAKSADGANRAHLDGVGEAITMMRQTLDRLDRFGGRISRPAQEVDLGRVIRTAVQLVHLELSARAPAAVIIKLDLSRKLPPVVGDAGDLAHVFVNLLLNARDAMPDGGTVVVEAHRTGSMVTVRVADEGVGFAPEHLARVFEPFFTTKGASGSGLGLALAYSTITTIGGTIRADNRPGGGAELTLQLPVVTSSSLDAHGKRGRPVRDRLGVVRRRKRLQ